MIVITGFCTIMHPSIKVDTMTNPSVSKALHENASCSDKKLKLYKDAYNGLLKGESDEMRIFF